MNLFINLYKDKNTVRQHELSTCLYKNYYNPIIDKIYCIVDNDFVMWDMGNDGKIVFILNSGRPNFSTFFYLINMYSDENTVSCIANSDIYFDIDGAWLIEATIGRNECYALSRWDVLADGSVKHFCRPDSADVWVFKGKVKPINNVEFPLGVPGCLSGETIIGYRRGKRSSTRPIKLEELYYKYNGIECGNPKWKIRGIPTYTQSLDIQNDKIIFNEIINVIQSGIKKTIKIYFEDNSCIVLTVDHLVALENKEFVRADTLRVGCFVLSKAHMRPVSKRRKRKYKKRILVYLKYHPYAETKIVRGHKYKRVKKCRLVYEAAMNRIDYDEFVKCLKNDPKRASTLLYLPPEMEIHHIDDNSLNDQLGNLEALTKEEHARLHSTIRGFELIYTEKKQIIKVESGGNIMTYDIQMKSPHHNFCANGIIVHNCDNAIANRLENAGYNVLNPSKDIRTFHLHNSGIRNYTSKDRVPPPYKLIHPHNLPKLNWINEIKTLKGNNLQSQFSEDIIISHIFKNIGTTNKYFVDLGAGAYDGKMSNTRTLKSNGWEGFGVDCTNITDEWIIKEFVKPDNVCQILTSQNTPKEFDFLNLDLDSSDFWVLKELLKEYAPRVICSEINGTLNPNLSLVLEYEDEYTWDNTNKYGYSFAAGKKLLEENGYVIIYNMHDTNIFAVKKELVIGNDFPEVKGRQNIYHPINSKAIWIQY